MSSTITPPPSRRSETRNLTLNIYREDDDYIIDCLEFGTVGQGATIDEALADWAEATRLPGQPPRPGRCFANADHNPQLIDGVRELEQAYAERIGQPVVATDIQLIRTISLPFAHA